MSDIMNTLTDISTFEAQSSRQNVKFSTIFKKFLKLQYLLRRRQKSYYATYLLAILMTNFFLLLAFMPTPSTSDNPHPLPTDHSKSLELTRFIFSKNSSRLLITSDETQNALRISNDLFQTTNYDIVSDIKNISDQIRKQNSTISSLFGLKINIDPPLEPRTSQSTKSNQLNSISFTTFSSLFSRYSPFTFLNSLYEYIALKFSKRFQSYSISSRMMPQPASKAIITTQYISIIYFIIGHALIIIVGVTQYFILNTNKSLFLLEINGVTSKARLWVNLVVQIIEHLPIDLLSIILFCFVGPSSKGTNFLLFFLSEYLFTISLFCIQIFFQPLLHKQGSSSAFCSIFVLYVVLFEYFIMFMDKIPVLVNKIFLFLFSPASFSYMCCLMIKRKEYVGVMGFKSLDYELNGISGYFTLIAQFVGSLFYVLLAILGHLCNENCFGKPPLGWRNIFKPGAWKRMISRSKERPILARIDHNNNLNSIEENLMNIESEFNNLNRNLFELDGLCKVYKSNKKEVRALNNVSLSVSQGEFIVALGSNGSGKTTLISSLIGAIEVDSGSISFCGKELKNDFDDSLYPDLGIVFQENVLFNCLSAREHFELFGGLSGYSENQIKSDMNNMLSVLKMSDMADTVSENLSGGSKRKLCVALSLLKKPSIVILDEPTAGVDAQSRQLIWKVITEFTGATVLTACHSVEECESISSRLLLMSNGQIAFVGTAAEMREKYNCCYYINIIENDNVDMNEVLNCANEISHMKGKCRISPDHPKSLMVPNNIYFADVLNHIDENKDRLNITKYTVQVENLEETMRKIIEDEEALIQL